MASVHYLPRPLLSPELRARCEATIELLVALLDAVDTPGADAEPLLGAAEFISHSGCNWRRSSEDADEREPDHDGEEALGWSAAMRQVELGWNTADGDQTALERHGMGFVRCAADDMEPSLAAPELCPGDYEVIRNRCFNVPADQSRWSQGARDDREGDLADTADDREGFDPLDDGEPTLGATTGCNQETAWSSHGQVCEDEPSLGATNAPDQTAWGESADDDRELVNEDGSEDRREVLEAGLWR